VEIDNFNSLFNLFNEFLNLKTEEYHLAKISDIILTYKLIDSSELESKIINPNNYLHRRFKRENIENNLNFTKFGGFNLPNTMDFSNWGNDNFIEDNYAIVFKSYTIFKISFNY
jgi:hypothetical protein